jgi:sugar lactone lactonase YvrE
MAMEVLMCLSAIACRFILRSRRCFACMRTCLALAMVTWAFATQAAAESAAPSAPANQQRQLLAALTELLQRQPDHVGAIYVAARTAASLGEEAVALQWLDRLAAVGLDDELDPDDFGAFAQAPAYRERAARFAAAAPPVGKVERATEMKCGDLLPEGTAYDPRRREVLVSSGRRRTVVAVSTDGGCREVVPSGDAGLLAVLGMSVDPATDSLWVASTAAPFMIDAKPADAGRAMLSRIDLAKGRVAASYALPGTGMLNDLARALDGSVYVTESRGGAVYRLAPRGAALSAITRPDTFESPNGIVALPDGSLLVADFDGLARIVDPAGPKPTVERLATPGNLYLGGIDGLALAGTRVIGIQNLVGRSRVWSLAIDTEQRRVTDAKVLLRGHSDFLNPTTGVVVDGRFVFVADPKLQNARPDGTLTALPAGRTGHRMLEVAVGVPR